jgi:tape measure domain-containing protein
MADQNYKLRFDFIANNTKFNSAIGQSSNKLKSFGNQMSKTGRMLSTRLSLPLAALGGLAVKQAANFERLQTTLNTLTGSAEEGAAAFEKLVQFSAKTPFQLDELVKVNNTLMGFGLSTNEAFNSLSMLGDIAGIVGGDLQSIGIAFGQAAAEGRVMTRDLRQFINNGVPILDILAESMGVARGEIMDMASEGKITFDILNRAFRDATGEGGKFAGGMNTLSQTLNGLFSTLKDNVNIALAELGEVIADVLNLKEGIPALSNRIRSIVDNFKRLSPQTQEAIIKFGIFSALLPPLLILLGSLIGALSTTVGGYLALSAAIFAANEAIKGLIEKFTGLKNFNIVKFVGGPLSQVADVLLRISKIKNPFKEIFKLNDPANLPDGFIGPKTKEQTFGTDPLLSAILGNANTEEIETNARKQVTALNIVSQGYIKMQGAAIEAGNVLTEVPKKFKETATMMVDSMSVIQPFIQGFANSISESFSKSDGSFKGFGASMLDVIGDLIIQMGLAAIAASNLAKTFAIPIAGAAAGLAAVALGGVIKGIANRVRSQGFQEFANGGIVSGPTTALIGEYPGARSNPEVVAPLSKLKTMLGTSGAMQGEFVLRGQDLVVALQRAERNRNRFK